MRRSTTLEPNKSLLDLAIDRFIEDHGEACAQDLVERAFKKAVARRKAAMN
jgi:hypothetical protein